MLPIPSVLHGAVSGGLPLTEEQQRGRTSSPDEIGFTTPAPDPRGNVPTADGEQGRGNIVGGGADDDDDIVGNKGVVSGTGLDRFVVRFKPV